MHQVYVSDEGIIEGYDRVRNSIAHVDAPTEGEIWLVRNALFCDNRDMISLTWLRNRLVHLRKAGKLRKEVTNA